MSAISISSSSKSALSSEPALSQILSHSSDHVSIQDISKVTSPGAEFYKMQLEIITAAAAVETHSSHQLYDRLYDIEPRIMALRTLLAEQRTPLHTELQTSYIHHAVTLQAFINKIISETPEEYDIFSESDELLRVKREYVGYKRDVKLKLQAMKDAQSKSSKQIFQMHRTIEKLRKENEMLRNKKESGKALPRLVSKKDPTESKGSHASLSPSVRSKTPTALKSSSSFSTSSPSSSKQSVSSMPKISHSSKFSMRTMSFANPPLFARSLSSSTSSTNVGINQASSTNVQKDRIETSSGTGKTTVRSPSKKTPRKKTSLKTRFNNLKIEFSRESFKTEKITHPVVLSSGLSASPANDIHN